jgi:transposase
MILSVYKYRLRPKTRQKRILQRCMGSYQFVYNCGRVHRTLNDQQRQKSISYYDQQNALSEAKKNPELSGVKEVPSQSLHLH